MKYEIKVTWTEHRTRNAACIGNDEIVSVEADSASGACEQSAEAHLDHHEADWATGKYDVMAEHVNGPEVFGIEYCDA